MIVAGHFNQMQLVFVLNIEKVCVKLTFNISSTTTFGYNSLWFYYLFLSKWTIFNGDGGQIGKKERQMKEFSSFPLHLLYLFLSFFVLGECKKEKATLFFSSKKIM